MRTRPLGKTGIDVSELSLGTWGLSGDGYGAVLDTEVDRTIDRALACGITLFETADVYGRGSIEKKLGERLPKAGVVVVTKLGTDVESNPAIKRFSAGYLRDAFERSHGRLKREKVDVVLLHNPTMAAMDSGEGVEVLKELKEGGRIRAWGVSAGAVEVALSAMLAGADVLELAYNVYVARDLHRMAGDIAQKAATLNPSLGADALRETPGVVLIDELDLHLHPVWQRRVIEDLRTTFPRIQFFASTHSPFLIQSLRSGEELLMLDGEPTAQLANKTLADIAEGIMGVRSPEVSSRYLEMKNTATDYLNALDQAVMAPEAKQAAFQEALAKSIAPFADNPAYQAFLELKRASKLGE